MSHFTTMVIVHGSTPPDQVETVAQEMLEPFNENTEVTLYKDYEGGSPDDHWYAQTLRDQGKIPSSGATWQQVFDGYNSSFESDEYEIDEKGMYQMSTYNPNSKWDWYSVGGRWVGYFPVKQMSETTVGKASWAVTEPILPGSADIARKSNVDTDKMIRDRELEAEQLYDEYETAASSLAPSLRESWKSWKQVLDECTVDGLPDYTLARSIYHEQPLKKKMYGSERLRWRDPGFFFEGDPDARQKFVNRAKSSAVPPHAVLDSEGWHEAGEMGWFGMSSDTEEDRDRWNVEFAQMWEKLDDDTWVVLMDCHI